MILIKIWNDQNVTLKVCVIIYLILSELWVLKGIIWKQPQIRINLSMNRTENDDICCYVCKNMTDYRLWTIYINCKRSMLDMQTTNNGTVSNQIEENLAETIIS